MVNHSFMKTAKQLSASLSLLLVEKVSRVRNLKFATYLKFATCDNTNKINELWWGLLNV